jgi:dihydropteroate synthase
VTPDEFSFWLGDPKRSPLVMGVLNVTPDSFSDGGRFADRESAIAQAHAMIEAGADLIDIGGESTRPGSMPVAADDQISRVVPVLQGLSSDNRATYSIDTTKATVAAAALAAGATLVNDISAGRDDPEMFPLIAQQRAPIVLMHMLGRPRDMQDAPRYHDVVADVSSFLNDRLALAQQHGIDAEKVLFDPGIGFGKTLEHNLLLIKATGDLAELGRPLIVGASRKRFIGTITDEPEPSRRLFGTAATVAWSVANGAAVVRVHDVGPMKQVVQVIRAIQLGTRPTP